VQSEQSNWNIYIPLIERLIEKIDESVKILIDESFIELVDEIKCEQEVSLIKLTNFII